MLFEFWHKLFMSYSCPENILFFKFTECREETKDCENVEDFTTIILYLDIIVKTCDAGNVPMKEQVSIFFCFFIHVM